jgi:hypothetical protein
LSYGIDGLSSPFKEIVSNVNNHSTIFVRQLNYFHQASSKLQDYSMKGFNYFGFKLLYNSKTGKATDLNPSMFDRPNHKDFFFIIFMKSAASEIIFALSDQHLYSFPLSLGKYLCYSLTRDQQLTSNFDSSVKPRKFENAGFPTRESCFPLSFSIPEERGKRIHGRVTDVIGRAGGQIAIYLKDSTDPQVLDYESFSPLEELHIYLCQAGTTPQLDSITNRSQIDIPLSFDYDITGSKRSSVEATMIETVNSFNQVIALGNKIKVVDNNIDDCLKALNYYLIFLIDYFYFLWYKIIPTFPKLENWKNYEFERFFSYLQTIESIITTFKKEVKEATNVVPATVSSSSTSSTLTTDAASVVDPILYLSVDGDKFCILKSTLQEIIPESQLTLRFCTGRWIEQQENLDKEGNIKINDPVASREFFAILLKSLRQALLRKMFSNIFTIEISKEKEEQFKEFLDYYVIENAQIITI